MTKEIINYTKNDISEEILRLQAEDTINTEVIEELEKMERTNEVIEALKDAYTERKRIEKTLIALAW